MHRDLTSWKAEADRIRAADSFAYADAARLLAAIIRSGQGGPLERHARQTLPSLQAALSKDADGFRKAVARRRFNLILDELHAASGPRFGRRGMERPVSIDHLHRRALGLPSSGPLYGPAIKDAFKRAAKKAHPDAGGNAETFNQLVRARDALIGMLS